MKLTEVVKGHVECLSLQKMCLKGQHLILFDQLLSPNFVKVQYCLVSVQIFCLGKLGNVRHIQRKQPTKKGILFLNGIGIAFQISIRLFCIYQITVSSFERIISISKKWQFISCFKLEHQLSNQLLEEKCQENVGLLTEPARKYVRKYIF